MKQPNSLVQISVNDVNLDSLSECAGQILAKEEVVLVIGGHLQHSSLLDKQKIYQAFEPRLLLLLEGEADLCVNLQDSHFEKGSIALVASDTIFEMKLLLSAKLQNDTISLSATPINRRCGFFFRKVSPLSQRVKVRRVDYCGYPRPSTNLFRDARRNCSSQCST